ncbi:MAG: signal peptidase I, partial [Chloroflexota bacterium]
MTGDSFRGVATRRKSNFLLLTLLVVSLLYLSVAAYSGSLLPLRLVKGTSMEPTLKAGDVVVVKWVPLLEIKAGDVIAFTTPEALKDSVTPGALLHRVIDFKVTDKGLVLITQGDNANVDPFPVPPQEVSGRMVARIPYIGWPLVFLTSAKGILFLSIGALLALLYIPAMALFYSNTVRKPDGGQEGGDWHGQTIVETVETIE